MHTCSCHIVIGLLLQPRNKRELRRGNSPNDFQFPDRSIFGIFLAFPFLAFPFLEFPFLAFPFFAFRTVIMNVFPISVSSRYLISTIVAM